MSNHYVEMLWLVFILPTRGSIQSPLCPSVLYLFRQITLKLLVAFKKKLGIQIDGNKGKGGFLCHVLVYMQCLVTSSSYNRQQSFGEPSSFPANSLFRIVSTLALSSKRADIAKNTTRNNKHSLACVYITTCLTCVCISQRVQHVCVYHNVFSMRVYIRTCLTCVCISHRVQHSCVYHNVFSMCVYITTCLTCVCISQRV